MEKKMTKREMFEVIKARLSDPAEIEFIDHEIELLAKRGSATRKPTPKQLENAEIKVAILDAMVEGEVYTIGNLLKTVPNLPEDFSSQRMSALIKQLRTEGMVKRVEIKGVAHFTLGSELE